MFRYCQSKKIDQNMKKKGKKKSLRVIFTSDQNRFGGGAQCTAECNDPIQTCSQSKDVPSNNSGKKYNVGNKYIICFSF